MDTLDALKDAITAWRKNKDPRFAAIAEWATARALPEPRPLVGNSGKKADHDAWLALYAKKDLLDVPRLLATVGASKSALAVERLTLLAKLDDPRVITGIFGWLEKPPYSARTAMPFFKTCAKLIADSGDHRARAGLEDLAGRYKAIVTTTVGDDFAAVFRRTAAELDQVKRGPLPAALEKKAKELEALFEKEGATQSRAKAKGASNQQTDDAFLAAIYAAPDDDAPRLVFADALTERGDVRGEFISLQLTRAKGNATPDGLKRERELCRDTKHKAQWALPLSQGAEATFARGFPVKLMLDPRSFKNLVGLPALRTVHRVDGFNRDPPIKHTNAFLFHEHAALLKSAGTFSRDLFDALTGPMNWEEVRLSFTPTAGDFARLPKLKRLELHVPWGAPPDARAFAGLSRLESLDQWGPTSTDPQLYASIPNVTELRLRNAISDEELARCLAPLTRLKRLELEWAPAPEALAGLRLEHLQVRNVGGGSANVAGLLDALPSLRSLKFSIGHGAKEAQLALAAGKKLAQLERYEFGAFRFTRPFGGGELTLRHWGLFSNEQERIQAALSLLPEGCTTRVIARPHLEDPTSFTPPVPTAEQVASLRTPVPLTVEWY